MMSQEEIESCAASIITALNGKPLADVTRVLTAVEGKLSVYVSDAMQSIPLSIACGMDVATGQRAS